MTKITCKGGIYTKRRSRNKKGIKNKPKKEENPRSGPFGPFWTYWADLGRTRPFSGTPQVSLAAIMRLGVTAPLPSHFLPL